MAFQPKGLISKGSIGNRMSLTESISSKGSQLFKYLLSYLPTHAVLCSGGNKGISHLLHLFFGPVMCHCSSKTVGFGIAHTS
ncbi:hypothetical protein ES703_69819 [subsurface metagenome]